MTIQKVFEKLDCDEDFTKKELKEICYNFIPYETIYEDNNRRWSRTVTNIYSDIISSRYFALTYDQGLTEDQEDEFYEQPREVQKRVITRTVEVIDWINKPKTAKWNKIYSPDPQDVWYSCSNCGYTNTKPTIKYCPNCGKEMKQ